MKEKMLDISEVKGAKANISDLKVFGDGDTFALLCKASSQEQGWMKSTKVCNVKEGCIVQVTTQQQNLDGSYSLAEALTYVPGMNLDKDCEPRRLTQIARENKEPVQEMVNAVFSKEGTLQKVEMNKTLENNFKYHAPKEGQPEKYTAIREKSKDLAYLISGLVPDSREKSIALTKLEEVSMWANAGIARNK